MGARKVEYTIPINFARREAYLGTVLGIIGGLLMLTLLVVVHEFRALHCGARLRHENRGSLRRALARSCSPK